MNLIDLEEEYSYQEPEQPDCIAAVKASLQALSLEEKEALAQEMEVGEDFLSA